jgi:hypothetical protein
LASYGRERQAKKCKVEKVEKKPEKRESHARWLEKRKVKGNKKL